MRLRSAVFFLSIGLLSLASAARAADLNWSSLGAPAPQPADLNPPPANPPGGGTNTPGSCSNSPESPTVVLAILGAVGAAFGMSRKRSVPTA